MPVFDPIRRCLVIRVVFDGPAFGGKTTNLRQLSSIFPHERRTEMFTPGALKGRTMFFDWLELDAGKLGNQKIRCQLLTVPGQGERSYRRRPLLESADGVIFVADSTPGAFEATKKSFSQLKAQLRKRAPARVPLIVQANKQDTPGVASPEELTRLLKLDSEVSVVAACAHRGEGVKETVFSALRVVMREVQARVMAEGIASIVGQPESPDELFDALLALEDDPPPPMEDDEPELPSVELLDMLQLTTLDEPTIPIATLASSQEAGGQATAAEVLVREDERGAGAEDAEEDAETRPLPLSPT